MNITLKPDGEKTRSIPSLQGIQKPDELDDLILVSIVSQIGKCICIMGGFMHHPYERAVTQSACTKFRSVLLKTRPTS